ncbi:MAG: hypothetical protein DRP45_12295 [Candidatus Zixiibacteriota bacterium]|nr:MAG: hypothetical protein DRP45_12295 [candidate division Zixibacteria bacterium]
MKLGEQEVLNRKYADVDEDILKDLERHFAPRSLVKKSSGGDMVDKNATLVACGAYEVISYYRQRVELGAKAK